jgi:hypothetical protein
VKPGTERRLALCGGALRALRLLARSTGAVRVQVVVLRAPVRHDEAPAERNKSLASRARQAEHKKGPRSGEDR